jgi:hypothetical protein
MTNYEIPFSDISTWPNIYSMAPSQMAIVAREDDVEDVNDDDIGMKMNRQVPLEELSPSIIRLNSINGFLH